MEPALPKIDRALGKRIVSGLVLAGLALVSLVVGGLLLKITLAAAIILMAREWARLAVKSDWTSQTALWFSVLIPAEIGIAISYGYGPGWGIPALLLSMLASTGVMSLFLGRFVNWAALGALYIGLPCLSIVAIRDLPDFGAASIIWMFLIIWVTDTMAFVSGRVLGGPKLIPAISPNKTWAGLIGGSVSAAIIGGILHHLSIWHWTDAVLIAFMLAVVAQAGDFLESHLKRQANVKDSGRLIPGHGGILDRVDGVMTAAPVMLVLVYLSAWPN